MNIKILTLFEFIFHFQLSTSLFLSIDFNFEKHDSLRVRDHNRNTRFYKHIMCYPANSKSVFVILVDIHWAMYFN